MKKFLFLIAVLFLFSCGGDDTPNNEKGLCDDVTCSNHGKCYVLNDVAKCLCDTGYHAEALECIENGVTNPCTGITCSDKGTCENNNGTAICNCQNGYHAEGLTCVENNIENPCTGVTCSGKGTCENINGSPVCECNEGYHAEGLTCVENPATCDGITCSGHGTCSIVNNTPVCTCDEGYVKQGLSCVEEGQDIISCKTLQTTSTRCEATKNTNSQYLLLQGNILSDEKVLVGGDVLIDGNGIIVCAQCDCSNFTGYANASKVVCANAVITPGLINAHDHISYTQNAPATWGTERFDHRHDWRKGLRGHTKIPATGSATNSQQQWGEFRNVVAGTTSMAGSGGGTGFLRNIDKQGNLQEGVDLGSIHYETFPLNDSDGTFKTADCSYPGGIDNPASVLSNDCYLPHVAEGIDNEARNEFLCVSSSNRGGKDLTERNSAFVHTIGLNGSDAMEMAENKTAVIWSPRSNISLYGNTASVTTYKNVGVLIGIGTDWTYSGSINIIRELQCAAYLNQNYYANTFSFKELWKMATKNNAVALSVADKIGVIKENRVADIAIFFHDKADYYQSIIESNPDDVILVLRGGKPLYGDKTLTDLPNLTGCDVMESVCGVEKFACIQREAGTTFSSFKQANSGSYMLYSCSTPTNEPTCIPFRPSEYSSTSTDIDKDGVADDVDNCPNIFNPKRPLDGNTQGNADQDSFGDACDVCPLVANSTNCVVFSMYDKDDDGIDDIIDNCPFFSNFGQEDRDEDGVGDSCDICPDVIGEVCEISIYSVKQGTIPVGSNVTLEGFVTAVSGKNFVIQTAQNNYDETLQAKFSGIYVYLGSTSTLTVPVVGDYVSVTGVVKNYFNELELSPVTAVTKITTHTNTMPVATVVNTADVKTGGSLADDYEGVLVKVENVNVTEINPVIHGNDTVADLCVVNNDLRIDNLIYTAMPAFTVGQSFTSITGILMFQREDSKLEPRNAADLIAQ